MINKKLLFKIIIVFVTSIMLQFDGRANAQSFQNSQELMKSLATAIQKNHNSKIGLIDALAQNGFIVLPTVRDIGTDKTKLPAPPDARLNQQIDELLAGYPEWAPSMTLLTFPSVKIGGLYSIEGSGDCYDWAIFDYDSKSSHALPTPSIFRPGLCTKDGSQSYLAIIDRHLAVLNAEIIRLDYEPGLPPTRIGLRLTLQSWSGKDWDDPAILKLGY